MQRSEPTAPDSQGGTKEKERGVVLLLLAIGVVAFIGMAGFAVDLGWIYLQSSNAKKASEAAALAAVAHMPLTVPQAAGSEILPGIPASDVADSLAVEHGYPPGATRVSRWAKSTQVRVDISSSTNTFFMSLFGIDTVSIDRHSVAEQLPPLKMGSDGSQMGSAAAHYWLAINGEERRKQDGDPFSTRCQAAGSSGCSGTPNPQFQDPAYYYAVDVPASAVASGATVVVEVFDGSANSAAPDLPVDYNSNGNDTFSFDLFQPDSTPGDPRDNSGRPGSTICTHMFSTGDPLTDGSNEWVPVCSFTPTRQGIHVLEVGVDGNDTTINGFGIRTTGASGTAIYGLDFMSLWMREPGTSPTLQLVRLDPVYAGSQLVVSAFDLGDISGNAQGAVQFTGAFLGMDCQVRVWNQDMTNSPTPAWIDDDSPGSAPCDLVTKSGSGGGAAGIYNNDWVEFLFDIPPGHSCSGSACWGNITYNFTGGQPTDRTTWGARINGTPIHLLNESTPSS